MNSYLNTHFQLYDTGLCTFSTHVFQQKTIDPKITCNPEGSAIREFYSTKINSDSHQVKHESGVLKPIMNLRSRLLFLSLHFISKFHHIIAHSQLRRRLWGLMD